MLRNTTSSYGAVAVLLHWLVALVVFSLFGLGLWMVELSYYDPWYRRAPDIHKSIGILLFATVLLRLLWRLLNPHPRPLVTHSPLERRAATAAHLLLYLLLFVVMASGYLISTADGKPIEVFGLFAVPATLTAIENQEDIAGDVHYVLAITLIALVALHAAAALKHHFIDRDGTLARITGRGVGDQTDSP